MVILYIYELVLSVYLEKYGTFLVLETLKLSFKKLFIQMILGNHQTQNFITFGNNNVKYCLCCGEFDQVVYSDHRKFQGKWFLFLIVTVKILLYLKSIL